MRSEEGEAIHRPLSVRTSARTKLVPISETQSPEVGPRLRGISMRAIVDRIKAATKSPAMRRNPWPAHGPFPSSAAAVETLVSKPKRSCKLARPGTVPYRAAYAITPTR